MQLIAIIEDTLCVFGTDEKLRLWLDAIDGLLREARIQYIQARLVDPVYGACSLDQSRVLTDLGLRLYCVVTD
jgi:hypothetical protein